MNLWLLACLVAGFLGAWAPAVHTQGVFEDCCLAYHYPIGWAVLRRAWTYRIQEVSGSCNLPAAIRPSCCKEVEFWKLQVIIVQV
ncbi:CCL25 isoform 3 [Pan troglodytes]|uniref:C-C motif chemokine ligand 25 n=2 Tax=Homininae TaxID=207598 RepID=F8VWI0_HUMAN|nr:CCL25 isoform 3 [Pan troglodytes]